MQNHNILNSSFVFKFRIILILIIVYYVNYSVYTEQKIQIPIITLLNVEFVDIIQVRYLYTKY